MAYPNIAAAARDWLEIKACVLQGFDQQSVQNALPSMGTLEFNARWSHRLRLRWVRIRSTIEIPIRAIRI